MVVGIANNTTGGVRMMVRLYLVKPNGGYIDMGRFESWHVAVQHAFRYIEPGVWFTV
jgi:hypothetical protein